MAVETFGVSKEMVLSKLPFDASQISQTSKVTPQDLTDWIEEGASRLTGALTKAGVSTGSLDDNTKAQLRGAIVSYAVGSALEKIGYSRKLRDDHIQRFEDALATYADRPEMLTARATRTLSNVTRTESARTFGSAHEW